MISLPGFTRHNGGEVLEYLRDRLPKINEARMKAVNPSKQGIGMKYDGGKIIAGVLLEDFPNALNGVCEVATFGANKYARSSWQGVEDGKQRYLDAMMRHMLAKGRGETHDPESGLPHSYHIAWNALAIIELEK